MNEKTDLNRIYHHYEMWEDWKHGFYNNASGSEKEKYKNISINMFNSEELTRQNMRRVINEWVCSCEHNLTNKGMNKIAYIGQAACCIYGGVPSTVTMECWSLLPKEVQDRSNKIAEEIIKEWINNNKNIQLCLNIY